MMHSQYAKHLKRRGFYMIGVLIVVVIILILTWNQLGPDPTTGVTTAQRQIDKSEVAACTANRQTLRTHIATWKINHMGEDLTVQNMQESGVVIPKCPAGGEITIDADGNVYCSKHAPQSEGTPSDEPAMPDVEHVMQKLNQ